MRRTRQRKNGIRYSVIEYLLDILLYAPLSERVELVTDYGEEVLKIERRLEQCAAKTEGGTGKDNGEEARKQGVTEQLKAENMMRWVGLMNNIRTCADKIVLNDIVYS